MKDRLMKATSELNKGKDNIKEEAFKEDQDNEDNEDNGDNGDNEDN